MPTVDLGPPAPAPPAGLLDALPRRLSVTLPELQYVAGRAGGAPLPFDRVAPDGAAGLDGRLGRRRGAAEDEAFVTALAGLHDPVASLARRGLLAADLVDPGLAGAVGLLATPSVALDLDVAVGGVRVKAWHRHAGGAVATLATADGIVFEIGWFAAEQWPADLARVAVVPEGLALNASAFPTRVDLPYELLDAAGEAARGGRADLVPVLAAQHGGNVLGPDGALLDDIEVATLLAALGTETRGRLRAMVADVSGKVTTTVGVVSWVLLADGWHALRPHRAGEEHRVEVRTVAPADLAASLAPVLAEVSP